MGERSYYKGVSVVSKSPSKVEAPARVESDFIAELRRRVPYTDEERLLILNTIRDTSLEWLHGLVGNKDGKGTAAAQLCYDKAQESLDRLSGNGVATGELTLVINNVRVEDIQTGDVDES